MSGLEQADQRSECRLCVYTGNRNTGSKYQLLFHNPRKLADAAVFSTLGIEQYRISAVLLASQWSPNFNPSRYLTKSAVNIIGNPATGGVEP